MNNKDNEPGFEGLHIEPQRESQETNNMDNQDNEPGFEGLHIELQREAQETYKTITNQLGNAVTRFQKAIEEAIQEDDIEKLEDIRSQILRLIFKLRKDMNNPHNPDIVTVLSEFEVVQDGKKFTVNEGLEERMKNNYNSTIETLNDMVAILNDRVSNYESKDTPIIKLRSIFKNETYYNLCLELMEELDIIKDGINILPKGRIGKLTGAIDAMSSYAMFNIENPSQKQLLIYFNGFLKTDYTDFSKRNKDYEPSLDAAKRFLKGKLKK
jgi:hypothetical protein